MKGIMDKRTLKAYLSDLLISAGIQVNGSQPWDIQIHHEETYSRVLKQGSLGLGESYMDGWWDCKQLDQCFEHIMKANLESKVKSNYWMIFKLALLKMINLQSKSRAFEVGQKHYDLGNDLFMAMLDKRLNYTCGYWKNVSHLDDAQLNKLELTCRKLMLKPNMRVLDIGCGFGSFAKYAAENYGVRVLGITVSKEQYEYAQKNCAHLPIEIRMQDYRDLEGQFDRVVSLGMFEHVGQKNYQTYMQIAHQCLKDEGLFLLHTIGNNATYVAGDEWITKYIFPNGMIPSVAQIGKAAEGLFVMEDWHNFGADYDKTLMAWHANFTKNWDKLKDQYDERFFRMWSYYLLSCAGVFRSRQMQLWQIVFSKGVAGGYQAPR